MTNVMKQQWCCLTCSAIFPYGKVILRKGQTLHCPKCGSLDIHPADKTIHDLPNYQRDDKGTVQ
jgi:DNA-directed RNA polymerase subunit RPC12/RpoP